MLEVINFTNLFLESLQVLEESEWNKPGILAGVKNSFFDS